MKLSTHKEVFEYSERVRKSSDRKDEMDRRKASLYSWLKGIIYHITLPVYLWSIGMKSLDEYIDALQEDK